MSRSLRDTAYKAVYAKEKYIKQYQKEPTIQETAMNQLNDRVGWKNALRSMKGYLA